MKLKIIDLNLFEKTNGMYFSDYSSLEGNFQYEYDVYAISSLRKQKCYLIYFPNLLFWCRDNKSIELISHELNEDWLYVKEHKYTPKDSWENEVKINDLYCYKWMIENESFFYDISENNQAASLVFLQNTKTS